MFRKKIIFILAMLGVISALLLVKETSKTSSDQPIHRIEPLKKTPMNVIAATGIIESFGQNINIGAAENGIIEEVYVGIGASVKRGDPLFKIDSSYLEAELEINKAKEAIAEAELQVIQGHLNRLKAVKNSEAISELELFLKEGEENLANAKLHQARVEKEKTLFLIKRLLICSPVNGTVLERNINKGEFFHVPDTFTPSMVIGDTSLLQIRADIDEQNAIFIVPGASGVASPKNCPNIRIPLKYLRIEPCVIPKKSLTGSSREKIDTRVLQVIYTFEPAEDLSLYVGQQVELYIERPEKENMNEYQF